MQNNKEIFSDKQSIRKFLIDKRKELFEEDKDLQALITSRVLSSLYFKSANSILCYVSMEFEISTREIIECSFELGKSVYVPKIEDRLLNFYKIRCFEELKLSKYGILEPNPEPLKRLIEFKNSLCITPCLAMNNRKFRIGYGGGYYDRFFQSYDGFKVGLCYSQNIIDFKENGIDLPVDIVQTEKTEF